MFQHLNNLQIEVNYKIQRFHEEAAARRLAEQAQEPRPKRASNYLNGVLQFAKGLAAQRSAAHTDAHLDSGRIRMPNRAIA